MHFSFLIVSMYPNVRKSYPNVRIRFPPIRTQLNKTSANTIRLGGPYVINWFHKVARCSEKDKKFSFIPYNEHAIAIFMGKWGKWDIYGIPDTTFFCIPFLYPNPSLSKPQYFGNVPLVFLCCSKFARSLYYCTCMSDSYQMKLTILSLRVLPINPLSQCMKFSCTTLLCLIAKGSTKQG